MMCWKCSRVAHSKCPGSFDHGLPHSTNFGDTLGTPQGTLQMSHSGTPGVLSLGKFKVSPGCSQLGHPGHMTWNTASVLTIFCAGDISMKLARKIPGVLGVCWVGIGQVHCPFPCSVFAVYGVRTLGFAPSVSHSRGRSN